jgi:hypothetical protein
MLKKQTYGDHESWVKHFEYLLPFFQDQRYILIDKKPVFIIYNSSDIKDIDLMMDCWNSIAIKN